MTNKVITSQLVIHHTTYTKEIYSIRDSYYTLVHKYQARVQEFVKERGPKSESFFFFFFAFQFFRGRVQLRK